MFYHTHFLKIPSLSFVKLKLLRTNAEYVFLGLDLNLMILTVKMYLKLIEFVARSVVSLFLGWSGSPDIRLHHQFHIQT